MYLEIYRRFKFILGALLTILTIGVLGYVLLEDWPVFDALYMTVITLATIGFSETHPLSNPGRAFTMILAMTGLGVVAYAFSEVTAFIVEGDLSDTIRRRKMEERIMQLKDHYIICGAGFTGRSIINELMKNDKDFVIVERDEKLANRLQEEGFLVTQGDALRDENLEKANIMDAKGIFCALEGDTDNVFVAISARGLNPRIRIISEVQDARVSDKLLRGGADVAVSSLHIGGLRMASEMIRPTAVSFLDSMIKDKSSIYRFEEVHVPKGSHLVGKPVSFIKKENDNAPLVLAIKEPETSRYVINPTENHEILETDILVVIGSKAQIRAFRESV